MSGVDSNISYAKSKKGITNKQKEEEEPVMPRHLLVEPMDVYEMVIEIETASDINKLSGSCSNERMRQAMLNDVRFWCDGISAVCDSAAGDDVQVRFFILFYIK